MLLPRRSLLPLIASAALLATGSVGALAAPSSAPHMDTVKVNITSTSGTVWGKVNASYTYRHATTQRSCAAANCTLHIPQGVTAHLSQTATDTSTWPFQAWHVTVKGHTRTMTANSVKVKVTGKTSITAVYVLSQSQSSGGYNSGGYTSGYGN